MNINRQIQEFKIKLKEHADPKRAEGAKNYLKSPWKFYGVDIPTKRKLVRDWYKNNKQVTIKEVIKLSEKLWNSKYHEEKTLSIMLLQRINKKLTKKELPLIEKMINQATGWDHIDEISLRLVSSIIDSDPKTLKYLTKWSKSKNFWVRRASLLSQIPQFRRKEGDKKLFFKLATPMFNEGKNWTKEERFFIRKAIGWVLREIAQKQPEIAFNFVKKHKSKMSGLTFHEATRKLPELMQRQLL